MPARKKTPTKVVATKKRKISKAVAVRKERAGYIFNRATGRWVLRNGRIGMKIAARSAYKYSSTAPRKSSGGTVRKSSSKSKLKRKGLAASGHMRGRRTKADRKYSKAYMKLMGYEWA